MPPVRREELAEDPRVQGQMLLIKDLVKGDKPISPRSSKWVNELTPMLESYNYSKNDIAALVKRCNFSPDQIEEAVSHILDDNVSRGPTDWAEVPSKKTKKTETVAEKKIQQRNEKVPGFVQRDGQTRSKVLTQPPTAGAGRGRNAPRDHPGTGGRPDRPGAIVRPIDGALAEASAHAPASAPTAAPQGTDWSKPALESEWSEPASSSARPGSTTATSGAQLKRLPQDSKWASGPAHIERDAPPPRSAPQAPTVPAVPKFEPRPSPPGSWAAKAAAALSREKAAKEAARAAATVPAPASAPAAVAAADEAVPAPSFSHTPEKEEAEAVGVQRTVQADTVQSSWSPVLEKQADAEEMEEEVREVAEEEEEEEEEEVPAEKEAPVEEEEKVVEVEKEVEKTPESEAVVAEKEVPQQSAVVLPSIEVTAKPKTTAPATSMPAVGFSFNLDVDTHQTQGFALCFQAPAKEEVTEAMAPAVEAPAAPAPIAAPSAPAISMPVPQPAIATANRGWGSNFVDSNAAPEVSHTSYPSYPQQPQQQQQPSRSYYPSNTDYSHFPAAGSSTSSPPPALSAPQQQSLPESHQPVHHRSLPTPSTGLPDLLGNHSVPKSAKETLANAPSLHYLMAAASGASQLPAAPANTSPVPASAAQGQSSNAPQPQAPMSGPAGFSNQGQQLTTPPGLGAQQPVGVGQQQMPPGMYGYGYPGQYGAGSGQYGGRMGMGHVPYPMAGAGGYGSYGQTSGWQAQPQVAQNVNQVGRPRPNANENVSGLGYTGGPVTNGGYGGPGANPMVHQMMQQMQMQQGGMGSKPYGAGAAPQGTAGYGGYMGGQGMGDSGAPGQQSLGLGGLGGYGSDHGYPMAGYANQGMGMGYGQQSYSQMQHLMQQQPFGGYGYGHGQQQQSKGQQAPQQPQAQGGASHQWNK